jgi:hypothetical protein
MNDLMPEYWGFVDKPFNEEEWYVDMPHLRKNFLNKKLEDLPPFADQKAKYYQDKIKLISIPEYNSERKIRGKAFKNNIQPKVLSYETTSGTYEENIDDLVMLVGNPNHGAGYDGRSLWPKPPGQGGTLNEVAQDIQINILRSILSENRENANLLKPAVTSQTQRENQRNIKNLSVEKSKVPWYLQVNGDGQLIHFHPRENQSLAIDLWNKKNIRRLFIDGRECLYDPKIDDPRY